MAKLKLDISWLIEHLKEEDKKTRKYIEDIEKADKVLKEEVEKFYKKHQDKEKKTNEKLKEQENRFKEVLDLLKRQNTNLPRNKRNNNSQQRDNESAQERLEREDIELGKQYLEEQDSSKDVNKYRSFQKQRKFYMHILFSIPTKICRRLKREILKIFRRKFNPVQWHNMRVLTPKSNVFGFDRGTPIDRVYTNHFLNNNKQYIKGIVCEIADNSYTKSFGINIKKAIYCTMIILIKMQL